MGLDTKGIIRPGVDADIVVLDPGSVTGRATFDRPRQYPKGISQVLINGEFVVRDNKTTGATPGKTIRKSSS